jgi:hypothetical protein
MATRGVAIFSSMNDFYETDSIVRETSLNVKEAPAVSPFIAL